MASLSIRDLVCDPSYILYQVDPEGGWLVFVPTTHRLLEEVAFLDGRTAIATGSARMVPIADALEQVDDLPPGPDRFIFHVSFCGSTLLSRILDQPGRSLVLREPNCLVDLANWRRSLDQSGRPDPRFEPVLKLACATLRARWHSDEQVVVKPSNWANNLLADLCGPGAEAVPLFITIEPRAFLRAVFRGGRDRIAFTARLAAHLAGGDPAAETLLASAIREAREPIGQVANLALLTYHLEHRGFKRALQDRGLGAGAVSSLEMLMANPLATAQRAGQALGLSLGADALARSIASNLGRHAKQPEVAYSAEEHHRADLAVEQSYGRQIDDALAWAGEYFRLEELGGGVESAARLAS